MNARIQEYMKEYDDLKAQILDSPLTDSEMAAEIMKRYPLWDVLFAEWLVKELRGASREFMSALQQVRQARNDLIVQEAMQGNRGC